MQVTIVGVKKSEYKGKDGKNKTGFNLSGVKNYTPYEQENADCEGQDVIKEFSSMDFNIHPGDVVDFIYEPGYQDKATLVDVRVLSIAENPYAGDEVVHGMDAKDKPKDKAAAK